jgi:cysteinyl-tRNA synthetase
MLTVLDVLLEFFGGVLNSFSPNERAGRADNAPLSFYNTLGKEKQTFTLPSTATAVRMYNCGPTVYDRQHIGNLSAAVFADIIRRVLEHNKYKVKQVINITDFGHLVSDADDGEDKMTKGLKREKKTLTMANMHDFATKYMDLYLADIKDLNVEVAKIQFPRASDFVDTMIAMIKTLEEKSYAYSTPDGVYFDTKHFQDYGVLGGLNLEGQTEVSRVSSSNEKHSPHDFALWKSHKKLGWDSPWGKGFPGWHLECSAMINSILGKQIDIHTGGIEHIAIHHNNEIAQSEAVTGKKPLSRFWMHREHIRMGDAKLAKSTGNTAYLTDVIEKGFHPLALRYWFLTSHYRTPANFSWEALAASQQAFIRLHEKMESVRSEPEALVPYKFAKLFTEHVNDDLNTPGAIATLWDHLKDETISPAQLRAIFLYADKVLALGFENPDDVTKKLMSVPQKIQITDLPENVQSLLAERDVARAEKNWARSDEIRSEIESGGFAIKDASSGIEITKK